MGYGLVDRAEVDGAGSPLPLRIVPDAVDVQFSLRKRQPD
jgi:hypothetical protein